MIDETRLLAASAPVAAWVEETLCILDSEGAKPNHLVAFRCCDITLRVGDLREFVAAYRIEARG